jgi:hypothetical protein
MMKCIIIFSLGICVFCAQSLFAASDSLSIEADSASADKDYWFKFDTEIGIKKFKLSFNDNNFAFLEFQYGRANMRHNDIENQDFAYLGSLQATIGYFEKKPINRRAPSIVEYDFESLVNLSYNSIALGAEKNTGRNEYTMWQVDLPERTALGYSLGNGIAIMPYYQNSSLYWSGVDTELLIDSVSPIARFQNGLRFGHGNQAGLSVELTPNISVTASYSYNTIFARHVFWQWVVTEIIHKSADGVANGLVTVIKRKAPSVAPIFHFLLRNAVSYGFYELRKTGMNWPFESEKALGIETFRVGVNFIF